MTVEAALPTPYPLQWPKEKPRTPAHKREKGAYTINTIGAALEDLTGEMWRCKVSGFELTSNYVGRGDAKGNLDDPGAALWFFAPTRDVTQVRRLMVMACDKFTGLAQNIRGISLTMQRLRLVDEIGAYSFVQAVEGAKALPPPDRPWWEVLHISEGAPLEVAEASYRALAKAAHPDTGGSREAFDRLGRAIAQARQVKK